MKVLVSYGSAWGRGKTHLPDKRNPRKNDPTYFGPPKVPICNPKGIYADLQDGAMEDVTCKTCLKIYARDPSRVST